MRHALVLSGGSIKGAFQTGAINEILHSGIAPEAIYGVSIGSLNGAFLAERAGRAARRHQVPNWEEIGDALEAFWRSKITSFDVIAEKHSMIGVAEDVLFNDFDGLADMTRLHRLVRREIKEENLCNSPVRFSAGVVNLASGEYIHADLAFPNIIDYIIASTAIPVSMPISMVAGQPLVDGGLRNVTPLKAAIDEGAEDILCVVCQAEKVSGVNFDRKNLLQLFERLMDIAINEIVNNDLEWAEFINLYCPRDRTPLIEGPLAGYRYVPIAIIRPAIEPDIHLETFDSKQIEALINLGHMTARNALKIGKSLCPSII